MKKIIVILLVFLVIVIGNQSFAIDLEKSYRYIKPIKISSNNTFIEAMLNNNWSINMAEKILGKPESYFDGYNIYFNKGVSIGIMNGRWTGGGPDPDQALSIIFNTKYKGQIVKGIKINSTKKTIVANLGNPQFESNEHHVFGYKANHFYIFFVGDKKIEEISVYRRDTNYDRSTLAKALKGLDNNEESYTILDELINSLEQYDYFYMHAGNGINDFISKGITVYRNDGDSMPIRIYGNYEGKITDTISLPYSIKGLNQYKSENIELSLDKDSVFELELSRLETKVGMEEVRRGAIPSPDKKLSISDNGTGIFNSGIYMDAGIFIFSTNRTKADREVFTGHFPNHRFIWLNNRYFIYSIYSKGILVYDVSENKEIPVIINTNISDLVSAKKGEIIYKAYDEDFIEQEYSVKYTFNKNSEIRFDK